MMVCDGLIHGEGANGRNGHYAISIVRGAPER
jgi:hypothetical protein